MKTNSKRRAALNKLLANPGITTTQRLIFRRRLAALDTPTKSWSLGGSLWSFICWVGAGIAAGLAYNELHGSSTPIAYNDGNGLNMQGGMDLGYYQRRGYPMGIQGYGESMTDAMRKSVESAVSDALRNQPRHS